MYLLHLLSGKRHKLKKEGGKEAVGTAEQDEDEEDESFFEMLFKEPDHLKELVHGNDSIKDIVYDDAVEEEHEEVCRGIELRLQACAKMNEKGIDTQKLSIVDQDQWSRLDLEQVLEFVETHWQPRSRLEVLLDDLNAGILRTPRLMMENYNIGGTGCALLCETLLETKLCEDLEVLDLWDNGVGQDGAEAVACMLPMCM
eukprot:TRINITY_DN752_c0_g1_i17.p1 TRINITY_DN752_c0_g1~~TRINITY_DN752_c0_g1_i17.p1  ORF type:complete len:200 (-),score=82.36 TRINITY_DN752_c0_g1_i17:502-1101(-)